MLAESVIVVCILLEYIFLELETMSFSKSASQVKLPLIKTSAIA